MMNKDSDWGKETLIQKKAEHCLDFDSPEARGRKGGLFLEPPEGVRLCSHFDFRLQASRKVINYFLLSDLDGNNLLQKP